jgi:hypothetical protein
MVSSMMLIEMIELPKKKKKNNILIFDDVAADAYDYELISTMMNIDMKMCSYLGSIC